MRRNAVFTESSLRQHPAVIKAFTGLPAEAFWDLIEKIAEQLPAYEEQRLGRAHRQRMLGGGRDFDQPLVIRVALVLTYLHLHIPQEAVAGLYGATQADVSRELRRLLPVIQAAEQRGSRPTESATRKESSAGKNKLHSTRDGRRSSHSGGQRSPARQGPR